MIATVSYKGGGGGGGGGVEMTNYNTMTWETKK